MLSDGSKGRPRSGRSVGDGVDGRIETGQRKGRENDSLLERRRLGQGGGYLGTNKEVFDTEVIAILRATRALDERGESEQSYTIFSDSQAAVLRVQHDRCGPAQALARAVIASVDCLYERGNDLTIRWTPSHEGVGGNEQADEAARLAAGSKGDRADPGFLREANLSRLIRKTTEARSRATSTWIRNHAKRRHRYRPRPGGRLRKGLARARKELAGRFYQLLSGHGATAEHLVRVGQALSDRCCVAAARDRRATTCYKAPTLEAGGQRLWRRVERDYEWGARGPLQSVSSSGMPERHPPC